MFAFTNRNVVQLNDEDFHKWFRSDGIVFLNSKNKQEALQQLCEHSKHIGCIKNENKLLEIVSTREDLVNTYVGMGIAIPHARYLDEKAFFVVIGIHKEGVDWNNNNKVNLIFLICAREDKQKDYLIFLSKLTLALQNEEAIKKIINSSYAEEVLSLFKGL